MSLKRDLQGIVPPPLLKRVPEGFTVIGDIAILSIPEEAGDYGREIGERIISRHHSIRTVLNKVAMADGEGRIAAYQVLAGGGTTTLHREFGYRYSLDVAGVFFNPRLAYERRRIAMQVCADERVLVPFCGVGPFAIPIADRGASVVAVEKQKEACRYLRENARMNHVQSDVSIIQGDASLLPLSAECSFDRAVIPTPYGMDAILQTLAPLVKEGGSIHFYTFKKAFQIEGLLRQFQAMQLKAEYYRRCGNVAPGVSRWVFDLVKTRSAL